MISRNNSTMKQSWVAERRCPRYRLQKLTVGVASVLLGTTLYFGGATVVHADTVPTGSEENSVGKPVGSNDAGSNDAGSTYVPMTSLSVYSGSTNDTNVNAQTTSDKVTGDNTDVHTAVNQPQVTNDKSTGDNADEHTAVNQSQVTNDKTTGDNTDVRTAVNQPQVTNDNATAEVVGHGQMLSQAETDSLIPVSLVPAFANVTLMQMSDPAVNYQLDDLRDLVMPVTGLTESKVATTTNGGYDQAKWGVLDTSAWSLNRHDDGKMWLDSYRGDTQHVIIPNAADFVQTERDEIYISPELIHKLVVDDHCKTLAISKTGGKKVAVIDNHVYQGHNGGQLSNAFGGTGGDDRKSYFDTNLAPNGKVNTSMSWSQVNRTLTNLDLTNLNVSQVTSGFGMFNNLYALKEIGDLSNWDTHNFTDMSYMFSTNNDSLTSLGDLSNWNTSKVTNMANMFCGNGSLKNLGDLSQWQTGNVTNMSMMFTRNSSLTSLDLSRWDTHNVTDMHSMFAGDGSLTSPGDLSNWDTHNVTDMSAMFAVDGSLTSLVGLSHWDTSKVTNMRSMFSNDGSLTSLDLSHWDTHNVTDMSSMFDSDESLTNIGDLISWDTSNVTDMSFMFQSASKLENLGNLGGWKTGNVTDMSRMFNGDESLTNIGDLSSWDTSNVTNMSYMFQSDGKLKNLGNLDHWKTGNVTDMSFMFNNMPALTNVGDLSHWDTHNVQSMSYMFNNDGSLISIGDLSNWDTSNVFNMSFMFQSASKLEDLGNLNNWKTGNVWDMSRMFNGDESLTNIGDLSKWDTSNVTNMSYMFQSDGKLKNLGNLDHWKTGNVTDMSFMFNNMPALTNVGDLSHWDTHNVENMSFMFNNDGSLVSLGDLSKWDTSNVTNMSFMFQLAGKLKDLGNLGGWKTGNVTDMSRMFNYAESLTNIGDLSSWDTSNVTDMSFMFQFDSKLKNLGNLNNWKTGNVWDMSRMFNGDESLTNIGDLSKWDTSNVTNMSYMFQSDGKLKNLGNLDHWKTGNVTDMSFMFNNMPALTNVGDLSHWDTHNVENMSFMFNNDGSLVSLGDLSNWDTSNVFNMSFMFQSASKLEDLGNLNNWKTGNVWDMSRMFSGDESLTNIGDLSKWDTSNVTNMSYMFQSDGKLKNLGNLGRWKTGNVTDMSFMFNRAGSLTNVGDLSNWDTHNVKDMSFMFNYMPNAAQLSNNFTKWKMDNVTTVQSMFGSPEVQKRFNISNFNLANVSADASKQAMTDFIGTPGSLVIANNVSFPSVDLKAQQTFGDQSVVLTDNQDLLSKTKDNAPVDTIKFVDSEGNLLASYQRPVFYQDTGATNITYDNALSVIKPIVDQNNLQFLQSQRLNGRSLLSLYQLQSLEENDPVKYANGTFVLRRRRQAPIVVNYLDAATNQTIGKPVTVNGKVGLAQDVDLTTGLPDGYQLFNGVLQTISLKPATVNGVSYDVLVKHRLAFISSNANYTTDSIIPGTKAKHFMTALGSAQLTSTVSRQIVIKDANGKVIKTVPQTITFVRNAVVDAVTGHVQYLNWSYDGQYVLRAYQPVARGGYQINAAPSIQVTPTSKLADVVLQYQAIPASQRVAFVTSDGKVLTTKDLPSNGDFSSLVPAGYRAVTTSSIINQRDVANSITYHVLVEPKATTYTNYDQFPSQVTEPLTKTITRTINITMPNGRVRKVVQQVHFVRTATVAANGKITYSNWTGVGQTSFDRLFVPNRRGYQLVMTDKQGQTLTGVNQMAVDPVMDNAVINVKYVK